MACINCGSNHIHKDGTRNGKQRYRCIVCGKRFLSEEPAERQNTYIEHFHTRIKETPYIKLSRENYCQPTTKISYKLKKVLQSSIKVFGYTIPNDDYADEENYTEAFVQREYADIMYNFDLNMNFIKKLNRDDFDKELARYVKKNKFKQTLDLNDVNEMNGAYIMVLDEYCQVYIGVSNNIKKRILNHWSRRKEFDLMLYGNKETSVIPIDAFGALDTTRIFYLPLKWNENYKTEEMLVSSFNVDYSLNRTAGGIIDEDENFRNTALLAHQKKRVLVERD